MTRESTRGDLAEKPGAQHRSGYWRSLDELRRTPEFEEARQREFPDGAAEWIDPEGRRRFLKIMGASLALAGAQGCVSPPPLEKIVPYVDQAEDVVPGRPSFYATSFPFRGYAIGVLVESHHGRPTKVEGNPDHAASLGGTNVFMQASVLDLYDPLRSRAVRRRGVTASIDAFYVELQERLGRGDGGAGVRILTEEITSPTLGMQLRAFLARYPAAQWHRYDPVSSRLAEAGLERVFGAERSPLYTIEEADVIVSLDADFLFALPSSVRYARMFARGRRVRERSSEMNRLYAVESSPAITGAAADHRLPLRPSEIERFAHGLAARLGVGSAAVELDRRMEAWLDALETDLTSRPGRSLVVAGETLPAELHALTHAVNERLQNVGRTVRYIEPVDERPPAGHGSLESLVDAMHAGTVDTLIVIGGNPVYTAPAPLEFARALQNVDASVHLSRHLDETSTASTWHLPQTHFLEDWSDLQAFDGTAGIVQPLIAPLYDACLSPHDLASMLLGQPGTAAYDAVRGTWRGRLSGDFERAWREALRLGFIPGTGAFGTPTEPAAPAISRSGPAAVPQSTTLGAAPAGEPGRPPVSGAMVAPERGASDPAPEADAPTSVEIVFRPDPTVWDGSFATNYWLQELPKPLTKLVWENAVLVAPDLAEREGIEDGRVVELSLDGRSMRGPAFILPGHPDHAVTVHLGYGRSHAGDEVSGNGFSAYLLRAADSSWTARAASLRVLPERRRLVTTQHHHSMEGRKIVEEAPIERFREHPRFVHEGEMEELPTLLPEYEYPRNKWGMTIDLNVCIGCNACIIACQAENNIPVVGREEVGRGREMQWLRVDRYYKGPRRNPETFFQPVPCMHCEKAPCEVVCPVYATVHDSEGLNVMVYNRCIGTRYCSNNCPYKVRRFNFLQYADWTEDARTLQKNPDVTVRSRGVMEKCTYCIQRISAARIRAKKERRAIRDGEVQTACQMACPTEAIIFGDLADEASRVHRLERQPQNYKLLRDQGTQPRTSYLAHFRNENGEMPANERFDAGQEEEIDVAIGRE